MGKRPDPKMQVARCTHCGELTIIAGNQGVCPTITCEDTVVMPINTVRVPRAGVLKALKEA